MQSMCNSQWQQHFTKFTHSFIYLKIATVITHYSPQKNYCDNIEEKIQHNSFINTSNQEPDCVLVHFKYLHWWYLHHVTEFTMKVWCSSIFWQKALLFCHLRADQSVLDLLSIALSKSESNEIMCWILQSLTWIYDWYLNIQL